MEAVILAGGKGSRLKPFTTEIPKPLVTIENRPVIEILLRTLKKHGVKKAHLAVNHLAHLIRDVLADGDHLGLEIKYSEENRPLSTVAPIKLIKHLPENFLVANGDILTDLDYRTLFETHMTRNALVTVATCQRISLTDYGILETNSENIVTGFQEKPRLDFTVSMGIYVFSRRVLEYVPDNASFGFDDLMYTLLEKKVPVHTFPFSGYWLDIGRPEDYEKAKRDVSIINKFI